MTRSAPMSVENEMDMIALPVIGSTDLLAPHPTAGTRSVA